MRTFSLFIEDRRYAAPTLQFVFADDEDAAREAAERVLAASADHLAIEVCEGGRALFRHARPTLGA